MPCALRSSSRDVNNCHCRTLLGGTGSGLLNGGMGTNRLTDSTVTIANTFDFPANILVVLEA